MRIFVRDKSKASPEYPMAPPEPPRVYCIVCGESHRQIEHVIKHGGFPDVVWYETPYCPNIERSTS